MLKQQHIELSKTRLKKSRQCYLTAINDAHYGDYCSANNRAYYSMFHAIRALLALNEIDFKKHSQVLGYFNKTYIHTGLVEARFNAIVSDASDSRNSSDYEDHYIATPEEAEKNIANAEQFLAAVKHHIMERFETENIQENLDEYDDENSGSNYDITDEAEDDLEQ